MRRPPVHSWHENSRHRRSALLSAGAPYEEILEDYPDLERDDILAAIEYAAHQTDHMVLQGV